MESDTRYVGEVVRLHAYHRPRADELTLARIARSREDAARRLAKTRDLVAWTATMARLAAEEALAQLPLEGRRLSPTEIVDCLRSLPSLWADSGTAGRQAIMELEGKVAEFGRGERSRADTFQLIVRVVGGTVTPSFNRVSDIT